MLKTLVIYFSVSGCTKRVAQLMAYKLGADLYQIKSEKPYQLDDLNWMCANSRANNEQKDKSCRPQYSGSLPDVSEYDRIIFGHPVWWRIPPRIMYTVIEKLNLNNKTIAVFGTSDGTSYKQSQSEMYALLDDLFIEGDILSDSQSIDQWLEGNALK